MRKSFGTVTTDGNRLYIEATPDVAIRLKRIFPRSHRGIRGKLGLSITDETCADIEMILTRWNMDVSDEAVRVIAHGADSLRQVQSDVEEILAGKVVTNPDHMQPARPLREYQRIAHALTVRTGSLLLADDLGLGKTTSAQALLADPATRPMLVVTLTGLERQWCDQLAINFPELNSHVITTGKPYDVTTDGTWPDMLVINYAKLAKWYAHLDGKIKSIVFDEVQELRRSGSHKHNAAKMLAAGVTVRMGLSATPVYNFGGEMFSILSVLRPGLLGSWDEFSREWVSSSYGFDPKARIRDPEAFRSFLLDNGAMLRRTRSDVSIELPEVSLVEHEIDADLGIIKKAEGDAAEIARLILGSDADKTDRFRAAGELDWKMRQATGIAKAPFVADFVRLVLESEEKVMLLGWHRSCYDIWMEKLRDLKPVLYTGSESASGKAQALDSFINGDSRVLIMSLRSGAGIDGLQNVCRTAVFGELDWSPGVHKQVVGRLHRPGQDSPVTAYFLHANYGADPFMLDTLNVKSMEASLIVDPASANIVEETSSNRIKEMAEAVLGKKLGRS